MEKSHGWHRTASAAAVIALLGLFAGEVSALSLGRISVQSSLGEPLKAEIEVPGITPEEAASLRANVASSTAFMAAGLEYNPAMSGLQITLARRADGRAYLRLSSDRAINDPFMDLILEANWSSGRIVRDYTMLFDPPSLKPVAPAPTLAQTPSAAPAVPAPAKSSAADTVAAEPARAPAPVKPAPAAAKVASRQAPKNDQQVLVKPGDSASQIAARSKTNDVSLDQMLVALLRANPDAFSRGNLNRLRSGAVLEVPTAEQAQALSPTQATQTVLAQSQDFNAFRSKLAGIAPKAAVEAADRKAAGRVQTQVEEQKPGSSAADKLTLSKGALQAKADEIRLTKERAEREAASRAAELAKNIADLSKLSAASAAAPVEPASEAKQGAALPALPLADSLPAPVAPAAASAPPAAKPAASSAAKPVAPEKKPAPGLMDQLMEDPTLPLASGGLLALLGGLFWYRRRQSKPAPSDSSFLGSHLEPDGFAAGQQENTDDAEESSRTGHTTNQTSSADDVDPVAEADVYLAYGRDKQAEEILKTALQHSPDRFAIHSKLLEIYAKRRDAASFLATANTAFQLVGGESREWARICELGLSIDPQNPLYQPGGATPSAFISLEQSAATDSPAGDAEMAASATDLPTGNGDLDLDLDFSAGEAQASVLPVASGERLSEDPAEEASSADAQGTAASDGIDFDVSGLDEPTLEAGTSEPVKMPQELTDLSLELDAAHQDSPAVPVIPATMPAAPEVAQTETPKPLDELAESAKASDGMMEFDLSSLSLDLGPDSRFGLADDESADHSFETKLALAEEFVSIGDHDGARALIEEVVAEATGELREKAQLALAQLS